MELNESQVADQYGIKLPEGYYLEPLTEEHLADTIAVERAVFPREAWSAQMLREELTGPYRFYAGVFDSHHTLVGYAGAMRMGNDAEIMTVGVDSYARGLGLGEALTKTLIESARESACEQVFLEVRESSEVARALYEKLGFQEIDRRRRYYHNPIEDAVIMVLSLKSGPQN